MRFTPRLCAQHLGWTFKKHWQVQGKRIAGNTGAVNELEKFGILVKDPVDILKDPPKYERIIPETTDHNVNSLWNDQKCYMYGSNNILLEGVNQALCLTKAIRVDGVPKPLQDLITSTLLPSGIDRNVQQIILSSNLFDAEQVKLSRIKNPERPAYNYPRPYGISHQRRNRIMVNRLLMECEKHTNPSITSSRRLIDQVDFGVTIPKGGAFLQLNITPEKLITSSKPIEPIKGKFSGDIPDLFPIKSTVSLPQHNIYSKRTRYPLSRRINCSHPHTIFTFFNKELMGNIHGTQVSNTQYQSRTLISAFTAAAVQAKQLYGDSCFENIPKPIVVQSIQTDGRTFHFGVFQLNTLQLDEGSQLKNYWFHEENMDLYAQCGYTRGRPQLDGYNKNVFRYINAFYHSG